MKKIIAFFLSPKPWFLACFYCLFAGVLCALTLSLTGVIPYVWLGYLLYFLSAGMLAYFVYSLIYIVPRIKQKVVNFAENRKITSRFLHDFTFRTSLFSLLSFAFNLTYALFQGVLAIFSRSIWIAVLAGYYALLAFLRGSMIYFGKKRRDENKENTPLSAEALLTFQKCGVCLTVLSFAMTGAIPQMVNPEKIPYVSIFLIGSALYTFLKIVFAVRNVVKSLHQTDLTVRALRNINLIDATVSVYVLQTAMLQVYSTGKSNFQIFNAISAFVVWAIVFTIGILMIVYARKKRKLLSLEQKSE